MGSREASEVTLMMRPFPWARIEAQSEAAEFDVGEDHGLKLVADRFLGKKLRRPEMAAAGIVDHDVEMAGFLERGVETFAERCRVAQVETNGMQARPLRKPRDVARCSPDFIAAPGEQLRRGQADARTGAREEYRVSWSGSSAMRHQGGAASRPSTAPRPRMGRFGKRPSLMRH